MNIEDWAELYKALADKTRLHILALLKQGELCVCELSDALHLTQPAISQHLRKLRQAGFVKERKTAQWVYYSLDGARMPFFELCLKELPDLSEEVMKLKAKGLGSSCRTLPGKGVAK